MGGGYSGGREGGGRCEMMVIDCCLMPPACIILCIILCPCQHLQQSTGCQFQCSAGEWYCLGGRSRHALWLGGGSTLHWAGRTTLKRGSDSFSPSGVHYQLPMGWICVSVVGWGAGRGLLITPWTTHLLHCAMSVKRRLKYISELKSSLHQPQSSTPTNVGVDPCYHLEMAVVTQG